MYSMATWAHAAYFVKCRVMSYGHHYQAKHLLAPLSSAILSSTHGNHLNSSQQENSVPSWVINMISWPLEIEVSCVVLPPRLYMYVGLCVYVCKQQAC